MNDYFCCLFIAMFFIFIIGRVFFIAVTYDSVIDAIAIYYLNRLLQDNFSANKLDEEFNKMKSLYTYYFEFWNWNKWTIIEETNRQEIRNFYLSRKTK